MDVMVSLSNHDWKGHLLRYAAALVICCWCPPSCSVAAPAPRVVETVDSLDGAIQSLRAWDVWVECSRHFFLKVETSVSISPGNKEFRITSKRKLKPGEKNAVHLGTYRQIFQGGKGRIELLMSKHDQQQQVGAQPTVTVYNGDTMKAFDARTTSASISMPAENIVPGDGWDYLHAYRNVQGHWPIPNAFRERKNVLIQELDSSLVLLESAPCPKARVEYPLFGFRVILDKQHGFMPAVIERFQEIRGKNFTVRQTKTVEWKALDGGIWAPTKVVTRYFDSDPNWGTFGELYSAEVLTVDVSRSSWNQDIPEDTFHLPLPAGTKVTDSLRGVQFITGQADPGQNLDDLASHAKRVVPFPVARPPLPEQPWWQKGWVIALFAASVFGLAALAFFRYRRRKAGQTP